VNPRLTAASLLAGLVLAVSACGGDTSSNESSDAGANVGAPINLADCTNWNDASVEERLGTIAQIREFTGGPIAGTEASGAVLEDQEAYDLFENACSQDFARAFKLYKLYGRAAAFQSYTEQAGEGSTPGE
jgi:hypothetical protein